MHREMLNDQRVLLATSKNSDILRLNLSESECEFDTLLMLETLQVKLLSRLNLAHAIEALPMIGRIILQNALSAQRSFRENSYVNMPPIDRG